MTKSQAIEAVWAAFPRRKKANWILSLEKHHTSEPGKPVWRWFLDGMSVKQDRYERQGLVDRMGVEVDL